MPILDLNGDRVSLPPGRLFGPLASRRADNAPPRRRREPAPLATVGADAGPGSRGGSLRHARTRRHAEEPRRTVRVGGSGIRYSQGPGRPGHQPDPPGRRLRRRHREPPLRPRFSRPPAEPDAGGIHAQAGPDGREHGRGPLARASWNSRAPGPGCWRTPTSDSARTRPTRSSSGTPTRAAKTAAAEVLALQGCLLAADLTPLLPDISTPTLILAASHDDITPVEIQRLMVEQMPNASLELYDGVGHNMKVEIPDAAGPPNPRVCAQHRGRCVGWARDAGAACPPFVRESRLPGGTPPPASPRPPRSPPRRAGRNIAGCTGPRHPGRRTSPAPG